MAQRATGKSKGRRNCEKGEALLSCRRDGSPVTVIVMRAWLAVAGVPPAAFTSKRSCLPLSCLPLSRLTKVGQDGLGAGNTWQTGMVAGADSRPSCPASGGIPGYQRIQEEKNE